MSYYEKQNTLTPRECEILELFINGLSQKQICKELHIEYSTIQTHFRNIYNAYCLENNNKISAVIRYLVDIGELDSKWVED